MAVEITRTELPAARDGASDNAKVSRRMLLLAFVLEGRSRAEAAENCGTDRQTLRSNACVRWVIPTRKRLVD